ncbi:MULTISPECIES: curli production assembly/transport component CsgF [Christiangramia]|uniref:Curli production assembly/transport component CsgF n=1 Tax=Christiangramia flava JLT2011 TaxID=1229726 RepID=A0A1L7I1Z4_9FLAO|nr:curli production assembly/transport component CsgF [Christiangramia flava]APU67601.1 Curli production assembly/transport component CsgF [Christiangramia flava JLT2011]OSS40186.1 Curli production assembly/transport component CsgF [Christiangramia flava JLT2011]
MKKFFLLIILLLATVQLTTAQDLVYKPINPAFGGDTFNYQWLLSSAQAQNQFKDPDAGLDELSDLDLFEQSINSQLYSKITSQLFKDQFGEGELQEGRYTFGNLAVDIYPSEAGLVIKILDTSTGEQTQIIIPNS